MDKTMRSVMDSCNNYFAVLYECVKATQTGSKDVKAPFEGKYTQGMLLRIHGAFTGGFGDFGEGDVYEVEAFDGETLTLDRELHTVAPWLFIAYLEPPEAFRSVCEEIAEWEKENAKRRGLASESIDGYSWSAAADPSGKQGFEAAFADRLGRFRNPRPTVLYYARNAQEWR